MKFLRSEQAKSRLVLRKAWRKTLRQNHAFSSRIANPSAYGSLTSAIEELEADKHPMQKLRTILMDYVDSALLYQGVMALPDHVREAVAKQLPELPADVTTNADYGQLVSLRIAVLRNYAGSRFRDRKKGDWFDIYRQAGQMRVNSLVRDLARVAGEPMPITENHRDAAMRSLNTALRLRLLQIPPGQRITRTRQKWADRLRHIIDGRHSNRLTRHS